MKKVLVVDDDPSLARTLELYFKGKGYSVEVANSGLGGLQLWHLFAWGHPSQPPQPQALFFLFLIIRTVIQTKSPITRPPITHVDTGFSISLTPLSAGVRPGRQ